MKDKTYLAISLNDFHSNQEGAETETKIRFISTTSIEKAKDLVKIMYPDNAWAVIPKQYFDANIVPKSV